MAEERRDGFNQMTMQSRWFHRRRVEGATHPKRVTVSEYGPLNLCVQAATRLKLLSGFVMARASGFMVVILTG